MERTHFAAPTAARTSSLTDVSTSEPSARTIESLWRRGAHGDPATIEAIRVAFPDDVLPAFLVAPAGVTLSVALRPGDAEAAAALVADTYWNDDVTAGELVEAHRGSGAWVGARTDGLLVGTARAISDGAKHAWIYDVGVRSDLRGQGFGKLLLRLLLDHPIVRRARKVHLQTRDAMEFYEPFGFVRRERIPRPYESTAMTLMRPPYDAVR